MEREGYKLDLLKNVIASIGMKYQEIEKIVLFGSRARGDYTNRSDIDLAIFTKDMQFHQKYAFIEDIENTDTLLKIDLVFVNENTDKVLVDNIRSEGVVMMEKKSKRENYQKAVLRLTEAVEAYQIQESELILDGLIQRFEFTTELAWKACREALLEMGYSEINGPKPVMKEAFANGIVDHGEIWIQIINDRNLTSHVYDDATSREIGKRIIELYLGEFQQLVERLAKI